MAVMGSSSLFVNASIFEESRSLYLKPVYYNRRFVRVVKSKKKKVMFCLNLNTKEVGLEFKPSFDQYLQIMENVKVARKQKKVDKLLKDDDKDVNFSKSGDSLVSVLEGESFKRVVSDKGFKRSEESERRLSKSGESLVSVGDKSIDKGFRRSEGGGDERVSKDVRLSKSGVSSVGEGLKRMYSRQEMVSDDRRDVRGFKRSEESGRRLSKSGESVLEDESFGRRYTRQENVGDKGFRRREGGGDERVTKDVRLSKSGESSMDEGFKRTYSRQEMVSGDKRIDRGYKRSEESGNERAIKDASKSKSGEGFKRTYPKQEMGRYQRSSDTSRGVERGYKREGLDVDVDKRRSQRISKDVKWSKSGESSGTVSEDGSLGRGSEVDGLDLVVEEWKNQRIGKDVKSSKSGENSVTMSEDKRYQRSTDNTLKGFERSTKGDGMDLVAEEKRIQRIANEMGALRRGKLTTTRRDDDDESLFDMESPAFRFSNESSDIVDKPATTRADMEDRINTLAKALNGADINMPEWQFSKAIRSAQIKYNDYTIMRLIQFLGKLGNWRRVIQVIEWLQRQDRYQSNKIRIIYTTALNVLGKSKRPVEALNVFQAMMLQISSYPDMVAYRSIAVTLGQAGHIKELFHVIDTMRSPPKKKFKPTTLIKWDPRLEPDVVVYNAVLNACVQRKQWEGAFWVLQQLKERGQKPSPVTYGLVMEVMLACEKYNLVHEFFRKMQKSSIPNALAYRVLVNTLWKEGKTDEAIQTVDDMESRGIVGSAPLYSDLARCLCSAGRCKEGLNMIKKICRVATKPLVVTYTGLIQACLDSGNIKDAAYIFDQMKEICAPNLVTCNIMLKAYLQGGLFEEARELFQKMSEDGDHINNSSDFESRVLPDTYTFNTMLDVCAKQKKWDDFGYAYQEMLRHGYHFNPKRHLKMVLEASRAGKEEVMEATWEHLRRSNRIPPSSLIKERFIRKLEKGDYVLAISSLADLDGKVEETELRSFSTTAWSKVLPRFEQDSVLGLMDDVNRRVGSKNESSDSVLGNLLSSCKEFMKNSNTSIVSY